VAKARALTSGRYHVSFDDVRALAHPVLRHRIITNFHAQSEGVTTDAIVDRPARRRAAPAFGDVGSDRCRSRLTPSRARGFMDPAVLARIGNLELVSRAVVTASSTACTRRRTSAPRWTSPSTGAMCRAMTSAAWTGGCGRGRRYYIKEYEAESNMNFSVLLDVSKSMDYGSRGITKLDYARILTACLTNLVHHQRDRVGFVAFDEDIVEHVPSSAKHMETILHVLDRLKPGARDTCRSRCTSWRSTSDVAACWC
jgi:hypothetical protein